MSHHDFAARTMPRPGSREKDARELLLIYFLTFPAFLVVALFARLLPKQTSAFSGGRQQRRSVFGEAAEMARSTLPMIFMG